MVADCNNPAAERAKLCHAAKQIKNMNNTKNEACQRIYTRCPSCYYDTLTVNKDGHLLCTWHECKDPTLIDRIGELVRAGAKQIVAFQPEELKALAAARCSAAPSELLDALKEIDRHIERLEDVGTCGVSGSIIAGRERQKEIIAALCGAQQNSYSPPSKDV